GRAREGLHDRAVDIGRRARGGPRGHGGSARTESRRSSGVHAMAEMIVTTPGRTRLRRLRRTKTLRNLVAETTVSAEQLTMPHFVLPAKRANEPISSMPGIPQMGLENAVKQIGKDL